MDRKLVEQFVERLADAWGDEFVSVVLYGSAAFDDYREKVSDFNLLCVLSALGRPQLEAACDAVAWWISKKQQPPVLLSADEVNSSTDAFAIEFLDIVQGYEVLHGEDVVRPIKVDPAAHRHQVERELRCGVMRLRDRYLAFQRDRRELTDLMCDSLPTFATLLRHAILLSGDAAPMKKHEVFAAAVERLRVDASPFETLLEVREGRRRLQDGEIREVFESYLAEVSKAADYVDRLSVRSS